MELQEKEEEKDEKDIGKLFERVQRKRYLLTLDSWSHLVYGSKESIMQAKKFRVKLCEERHCWHRHSYNILEWREKNQATYYNENEEVELVQKVQMSLHQSNTYIKRLTLATFRQWAKGSRNAASERQTILHIRFCSLAHISK